MMLKMPLRVVVTAGLSVALAGTQALPAAQGGAMRERAGVACGPTVAGFGTRGGLTAQLELNPGRATWSRRSAWRSLSGFLIAPNISSVCLTISRAPWTR
jgi:hypothetical protein